MNKEEIKAYLKENLTISVTSSTNGPIEVILRLEGKEIAKGNDRNCYHWV